MKVTARDISILVKDTQLEMMRKRSAEPKESLIDALINDEIGKMTSLVEDDGAPQQNGSEGSLSLDPSAFVDTQNWTGELLSGAQTPGAIPPTNQKIKRPTRPPPNRSKPPPNHPTPQPGELESLEQMLEPERTGVHKKGEGKPPWILISIILLLLAAGAAAAVVFAMQ
jgi:hypothetical protein